MLEKTNYGKPRIVSSICKTVRVETFYKLVEDEELVKDLVELCKDKYEYKGRPVDNEKVVRELLSLRARGVSTSLRRYSENEDEEYITEWPSPFDNRWEGDYNPNVKPRNKVYGTEDMLVEFMETHYDKCKWKEETKTHVIKEHTYYYN